MQVLEVVERAQGGAAVANLAEAFGIGEDQARAVLEAVTPDLAYAVERNTLSRGGLADLVRALGSGHHEAILESPAAWTDPRVAADGRAILLHLLGSDIKVARLSDRAARASGLGGGIIEALLPIIAQLIMGAIARYAKGGLGDILSRLPVPGGTGAPSTEPPRSGGRSSRDFETGGTMGEGRGFDLPQVEIPREGGYPMPPIPGGPGDSLPSGADRTDPLPMPAPRQPGGFEWPRPGGASRSHVPEEGARRESPRRRSGFELPDVTLPNEGGYRMPPIPGGSSGEPQPEEGRPGGFPFPLPGPGADQRRNPYDDLSDILRRGGSMPAGNDQGDGLWRVIRGILGGVMGFGGRGVLGWLVQLVVMRWGWRILQRILFGRR